MIEFRIEVQRDLGEGERHVVIRVADAKASLLCGAALVDRLFKDCRSERVERDGRALRGADRGPALVGLARSKARERSARDLAVRARILRKKFIMRARAVVIAGAFEKRTVSLAADDAAIGHQRKLVGGARLVVEARLLEQERLMQRMEAAKRLVVLSGKRLQRRFGTLRPVDRPSIKKGHRRPEIRHLRAGRERRARVFILFMLQRSCGERKPREIVVFLVFIGENLARQPRSALDVAGGELEEKRTAQEIVRTRTIGAGAFKRGRRRIDLVRSRSEPAGEIVADDGTALRRAGASGEKRDSERRQEEWLHTRQGALLTCSDNWARRRLPASSRRYSAAGP
jgi:hypothetical protein